MELLRASANKKFDRQFEKLTPEIQKRFYERLQIFEKDRSAPLLHTHSVDAVFPGCQSINITGDYRAIFYEEGDVVLFVAIGTHAQLYG